MYGIVDKAQGSSWSIGRVFEFHCRQRVVSLGIVSLGYYNLSVDRIVAPDTAASLSDATWFW